MKTCQKVRRVAYNADIFCNNIFLWISIGSALPVARRKTLDSRVNQLARNLSNYVLYFNKQNITFPQDSDIIPAFLSVMLHK